MLVTLLTWCVSCWAPPLCKSKRKFINIYSSFQFWFLLARSEKSRRFFYFTTIELLNKNLFIGLLKMNFEQILCVKGLSLLLTCKMLSFGGSMCAILKFVDLLHGQWTNTRNRCEICSKLTVKTPEWCGHRSGVFIVNFKHILHLF